MLGLEHDKDFNDNPALTKNKEKKKKYDIQRHIIFL